MALTVDLTARDRMSRSLKKVGGLVKGMALGFGNLDRLFRSVLLVGSVKLAGDMGKGLREIGTLVGGLNDKEFRDMGQELQNIAAISGQAMDSLVKARYDIVSAGFTSAADSAMMLETASQLAMGGVTSVANAADLLTTTINAYNLSARESMDVSDKLFTIVRLGKTTMNELGGSMGRILAIAGQTGVSLDEVGAAMATLTASGQKTEEATTAIRSAIVELMKPSDDLAKALKSIGIESGEALIKEKGFAEALRSIKKAADENNTTVTQLLGNIRTMQAVLPLTGTAAEKFAENLVQMDDSMGATTDAVKEMNKSFNVQMSKMKQNVTNILREIGGAFIRILFPKIEETNKELEKLGKIGWDVIGEVILSNWRIILETMIKVTGGAMAEIGNEIRLQLAKSIGKALTETFPLFSSILGVFFSTNEELIAELEANTGRHAENIKTIISDTLSKLGTAIEEVGESNKKTGESFEIMTNTASHLESILDDVEDSYVAVGNAAEELDEKVKTAKVQMMDFSRVLVDSVTAAFQKSATSGDMFKTMIDSFLGLLQQAAIAALGLNLAIKNIFTPWGTAAIVAALASITAARAAIQNFDQGGIARSYATGGTHRDTVPAVLSVGEGVSTPEAMRDFGDDILRFNQLAEGGGGGGGSGGAINVFISTLDGADVERVINRNPAKFARGMRNIKRKKFRT